MEVWYIVGILTLMHDPVPMPIAVPERTFETYEECKRLANYINEEDKYRGSSWGRDTVITGRVECASIASEDAQNFRKLFEEFQKQK
jgi:hypothetical protein